MNNILKEIEQVCNTWINTKVCGIDFELKIQKEKETIICSDMMEYLPPDNKCSIVNDSKKKTVKIYYVVDDIIFEKMKVKNSSKESTKVHIYRNNSISKIADYYDYSELRVFFCEIEPYYICTIGDKIYIILRFQSKNINRLYFRVMVEFVLRAKKIMGYHMIHAACISVDGKGVLICGEKGAGKTTLMSHFLNSGRADYIANDKVFLTSDLSTVEYVPIVARIGEGTLKNFSKYDLKKEYRRISIKEKEKGKEVYGNDKWNFTPVEVSKIFGCEYKSTSHLDAVLISNIGENNVEKLTKVQSDVLEYDILKDEYIKIQNWLLNDTWIDYFKNQKSNSKNMEKSSYKVCQVDYNYKSQSVDIMDKVCQEVICSP